MLASFQADGGKKLPEVPLFSHRSYKTAFGELPWSTDAHPRASRDPSPDPTPGLPGTSCLRSLGPFLLILPPRSCQPPAPSRGTGRGLFANRFARRQLRSHLSRASPLTEHPRRTSSPRTTCPSQQPLPRRERASRGGAQRGNGEKQQRFTAWEEKELGEATALGWTSSSRTFQKPFCPIT